MASNHARLWVACLVSMTIASTGPGRADDDIIPLPTPNGHWAIIKDIAFSPDGAALVTAGYDKSVLFWDLQSGTVAETARAQIGPGEYGRIHALAVSPDAKWLAVAGFMAPGHGVQDDDVGDILLFD